MMYRSAAAPPEKRRALTAGGDIYIFRPCPPADSTADGAALSASPV